MPVATTTLSWRIPATRSTNGTRSAISKSNRTIPQKPADNMRTMESDSHIKSPRIPEQQEGKQVDLESRAKFADSEDAKPCLQLVKNRMFDINQWDTMGSVPDAMVVEMGRETDGDRECK